MNPPHPRLRIHHPAQGALILRESLRISFYFLHAHRDIARHVRSALDIYRLAVGADTLAWYPDEDGDFWELDARGWERIRHRLRDEGGGLVTLVERPDAISGYGFEYRGADAVAHRPHDVCAASFWLPTEYLEEHGPARVHELALDLGASLPFTSGHAGLAFHRLGRTPGFQALCASYPGIDATETGHLSWNLGHRLNGIHWMNFLGPSVLAELGGVEGLRSRLPCPGTTVRALGDARAVITLGSEPDTGESGRAPLLPAYRELARVLEPWLYVEHHDRDGFTPEEWRRWERRFLD